MQYRDADEGQQGDHDQPAIFQSAAANTPRGGEHDGDDRRLDAIQHTGDDGDITKSEIDPGQQDKYQQRGQDKQQACDDAAERAMHEPADVDG